MRPEDEGKHPSEIYEGFLEGLRAARRNARPAAVIIALMVAMVLGYEYWPLLRNALDHVAATRERVGLIFGVLTTAAFGGALPLVFRRLLLGQPATPRELLFGVLFWAYKGLEVGIFYDLQADLWGDGSDLRTIATKTLVDQTVYGPLLAVPNMTLGYLWLECDFSLKRMRSALREKGFLRRALPVLISNAMFWIPAISLVYMFPTALQLPLSNLCLIFWVLMLMIVARRAQEAAGPEAPEA